MAALAGPFEVHPNHIQRWKKQLLKSLPKAFGQRREKVRRAADEQTAVLYEQIEQLKMDLAGRPTVSQTKRSTIFLNHHQSHPERRSNTCPTLILMTKHTN